MSHFTYNLLQEYCSLSETHSYLQVASELQM